MIRSDNKIVRLANRRNARSEGQMFNKKTYLKVHFDDIWSHGIVTLLSLPHHKNVWEYLIAVLK